jgi:hypothetical protein
LDIDPLCEPEVFALIGGIGGLVHDFPFFSFLISEVGSVLVDMVSRLFSPHKSFPEFPDIPVSGHLS